MSINLLRHELCHAVAAVYVNGADSALIVPDPSTGGMHTIAIYNDDQKRKESRREELISLLAGRMHMEGLNVGDDLQRIAELDPSEQEIDEIAVLLNEVVRPVVAELNAFDMAGLLKTYKVSEGLLIGRDALQ